MSYCLRRSIIRTSQILRCTPQLSRNTIHFIVDDKLSIGQPPSKIFNFCRYISRISNESSLNDSLYEKVCKETLESLTEFFEELVEVHAEIENGDISYNDGVLTFNLGNKFGTYVINRQLPNKQIWLSSPVSGPKRYDFENGCWIYKHNNKTLHSLLEEELSILFNKPIDLSQCLYYK